MRMRRLYAALGLPFMLIPAAQANAQADPAPVVGPVQPAQQAAARPPVRDRAPALREQPDDSRAGLIAAAPVGEDAVIGLGRFSVGEIARLPTNTEFQRNPADIRRRNNRIAGLGFSLRF